MRPPLVCDQCGGLVAPELADRHAAWHDTIPRPKPVEPQPKTPSKDTK